MKDFDVHFIIKFSDFFGSVEGKSKGHAKINVLAMLQREDGKAIIRESILGMLEDDNFEVEVTDVLEVGKDI